MVSKRFNSCRCIGVLLQSIWCSGCVLFGGDTVAVVSDYLVYLVVMLIEKRMMVVSGVISILLSL